MTHLRVQPGLTSAVRHMISVSRCALPLLLMPTFNSRIEGVQTACRALREIPIYCCSGKVSTDGSIRL